MDASKVMEGDSGNAVVGSTSVEGDTAGSAASQNSTFPRAKRHFTANLQLFNLFANQTATALKTLGEGLAGIARKQ